MYGDAVLIGSFLGVVYILLLLYLDKYEREPLSKVALLYAGSILATWVFGHVAVAITPDDASTFVAAFFYAGFLEEGLKFGLFLLVLWRWRRLIDEAYDCILYLGIIALGFAVLEDVGYFIAAAGEAYQFGLFSGDYAPYKKELTGIVFLRALPGHLLFDTIGGYVVGLGLERGTVRRAFIAGFLIAVLLHGTWNALASVSGGAWLLYLGVLIWMSIRAVRAAHRKSLYGRMQKHWGAEVRAVAGEFAAIASAGCAEPTAALRQDAARILVKLGTIARCVGKLPVRLGSEQAGIYQVLESHLRPLPAGMGESELLAFDGRLDRIAASVRPGGWARRDLLYWGALWLIFLVLGVAVIFLAGAIG